MRKFLLLCLVIISIEGFAQPTNYIWYKQRTRQYSMMIDSMLFVPRYNGTPSGVRVGENSAIDGAVAVDTANNRFYIRSGGAWVRVGNYSESGIDSIWRVAGKDSIFWSKQGNTYKIKDSTGGGGVTPTLQEVLTAGSMLTTNNTINTGTNTLTIIGGGSSEDYLIIDPTTNDEFSELRSFNTATTSDSRVKLETTNTSVTSQLESDYGDGIVVSRFENNVTSTVAKNIITSYEDNGKQSIVTVDKDSISIEPSLGILNVDSLRTWSAVADTTHKKLMTWDTRNGRWEYASNWFGGGGGGSTSPAGNFGNLQINRNGVFATPGSDSLDFESATGLSVKGNVNVTGLINAADGSSGNPSITFTTSDNEGFWLNGTGNLVMANQNQNIWQTNTAAMRIKNTVQVSFSSGDPTSTGADIGIARDAAGVLRVTNGSTGYGDITSRQIIIGSSGTFAASATAALHIYNGTDPTASITNGVLLYSTGANAELTARDEAGNITTLSPHNFGRIPGGRSEPLAWSYNSQRDGQYIAADMALALRTIEELTKRVAELEELVKGEKGKEVKLIHTGKIK